MQETMLPHLRERLTAAIEAQPEVLLERDGGPVGMPADVILATLYGFDDQVDAEWRIGSVKPYLLMPIPARFTAIDPGPPTATIRTARYELQSNYAACDVDWTVYRDALPSDVRPARGTYLVKILLVRYRRRAD